MSVFDSAPAIWAKGRYGTPSGSSFSGSTSWESACLTRTEDTPDGSFDRHVSAAGWVDRDVLLVASETDLFRFDLETGAQETWSPLEADNR
jgi:sugar lactone lactonase YvrE